LCSRDIAAAVDRPWYVSIGMRATVIAHFNETQGVTIEDDAFIGLQQFAKLEDWSKSGSDSGWHCGPFCGTDDSGSRGNPAKPVAKCAIVLTEDVTLKDFSSRLKQILAIRHLVLLLNTQKLSK